MNAGMTDQCIAVAKPCGYESHNHKCSATVQLYKCLEIGVQYALLMRANKPVQSSAPIILF